MSDVEHEEKTVVPETSQEPGLATQGTQLAQKVYGQVKDYSPIIKTGLESVESRIPQEWVAKAQEVGQPVVVKIDEKLEVLQTKAVAAQSTAIAAVETVVGPAVAAVDKIKELVIHPVGQGINTTTTITGTIINSVNDKVQEGVVSATHKVSQWQDLRGEWTARARTQLEEGLEGVKAFSAQKQAEIMKSELIEYSRQMLDDAAAVAKRATEPLQPLADSLVSAVEKTKAATASLQESVENSSGQVVEAVQARGQELQVRLASAMAAALDLSTSAGAYVREKYTRGATVSKGAAAASLDKLPTPMQAAVVFILNAPKLFTAKVGEVQDKAAIDRSRATMANATALLAAIKEVLFRNGDHGAAAISIEDEAKSDAVETTPA